MQCPLSGDEAGIVFSQLCNALEPRVAVAFSSISHELWEPSQAQRQQLRTEHEAAAALCLKVGQSCKELREARDVTWVYKGLTPAEVATLGSLGSVLPALEVLILTEYSSAGGPEGVQRLAAGLGAGALPSVTMLVLDGMRMGYAGASALAAALGRGALPRLEILSLNGADIGDAGLVALAPALRRCPVLQSLNLFRNPFGDAGLAALVAPPLPAGALPPPTGGLKKLEKLYLSYTQVSDAGCATLASALDSGALPALEVGHLCLEGSHASAAGEAAVREALKKLAAARATI